MSGKEQTCLRCDGAGLIPLDPSVSHATNAFLGNVQMCPGCNGVGVVIVDGPKPIKYDLDAPTKRAVFEATGVIVCRKR